MKNSKVRRLIFALSHLKIIKNRIAAKKITKCLLLFHPRSGSSWLIKLLEENKNFKVGYEILGDYQYSSESAKELEQKNILNNFYNYNLDRATLAWNNQQGIWTKTISSIINALGSNTETYSEISAIAKIAPYQVINKQSFIEFVTQNNIKVICLTRDNIFKLAVSEYRKYLIYEQIGKCNITNEQPNFRLGTTQIEKNKIFSFLDMTLSERKNVMEMANLLASNKVDVFSLTYEDLFENTNSSLQQIEDFIGTHINIRQTEKIFKITDDRLENIISNYEEFKEWMDEYLISNELDYKYFEYLN